MFGLAPLTGVPLPFVSYGNASMLVMLAGVGLLLNVSRGGSAGRRASRRAPVGDCASSTAGASPGEPPAPRPRGAPEPVPQPARVVIAAGGTAGHVVPALAVADALRAEGAEVSFLGAADRAEAEVVPAAGYEIDLLRLRGLDRANPVRAAGALRLAAAAVPEARRVLRRREAGAVLGGGGYVAGPAGLAASSLRLPLVLTEADRHLGLTNRLLARRARRVCLAFPIDGLVGDRYLVTGRPIPAAVLAADRDAARERFGIAAADVCLLVFGGSQGARSINLAALEAFSGPGSEGRAFHVLHISGSRDYEIVREALGAAPNPGRYTLLEYEPDSPTRSPPPTSSSRAPAARSSRSPPRAVPRSWSRIRTRPGATSTPTRNGCATAGRPS